MSVPGAAQVTSGLVADYRFDEGSGASIADVSGNGHDGTAYGAFSWETGQLRVTGTSLSQFGHVSLPRGNMLDASWTVDLIFEAQNSGEHTAGRVWSAASGVGGTGPEVFFRSGNYLGFRINNPSTVWDPPAVGSRSTAAPPDHYVLPTTPIAWGVPHHYVVTHDAAARRVRMYLAPVAAPDLALVFDGTYTGSYAVGPSDLRLSHSHDDANPRYISGAFDRLRIYDRALGADEAEQNHDGGNTTEFVVDPYPIDLSLGISRSGHYFSYRGRPRMMLMDSGTQCVMQNLDVDYRAWVDRTGDEGHAGVHIWAFVPPRQRLDGSVVEERWGYVYPGITPWPRKTEGANAADGGKQWDLMSFDEGSDPDRNYWPRLRDLCQRLRDQDRVLGITVFFGWPKDTADFPYHPFAAASGGPAASRSDITHIESPGTEIHQQAYSDSWPARRKVQWLWERFALKLIETSDSCGNVWFDFRDEWSYDNDTNMEAHFRTFFMSRGQLWADRSAAASFRVANPVVPAFGATPSMKTEGEPYEHGAVRVEVWTRALGGIHFLLHNDSRDPGIMAWDATAATIHGLDPATDRGRQYVGHAARFFNTELRSLDAMVPDDGLVSGSARCLATPGLEYAIYIPAGQGTVAVDLTPVVGDVQARFLDPRLGLFEAASVVAGAASRTFSTPASNFDWVLHLVATRDGDSDGLADVDERANGTNPDAADTDGDGYGDAAEVNLHGTNPRDRTNYPGATGDGGSDAGRDAGAGTDAGGDAGRDASVDASGDADRSDDGGEAPDIGGGNDRAGQVADSGAGDGGGGDRGAGSDAGTVPGPGCGGCTATSAATDSRASADSVLGAALLLWLGLIRWRRSKRPMMRNAIVTLALLLAASCPPVGTASPFDANLARDASAFDLGQSADVISAADAATPPDAASRDRGADGGASDHTVTDRATADTTTGSPDRNAVDTGAAGGSDAGTGAECDDDVDCGDGRGCLNGFCHDNCLLGLYCPESSGVACVQGVCVECRDDADCPGTRYACDPATYACRDRAFDPSATKFGIFYHTWHCRVPRTGTVPDLSEVLAGRRNFDPDYDTVYWWDQPAAGYYCLSENDALLRTHAERLRDAGIDFVFLDVTNHNYVGAGSDDTPGMILEPLDRLLAVWSTVTGAPKVSAWVPVEQATEDARRYTVDAINARLANYPALRFIYRGKPLLLITENSEHPVNATRVAQLAQDYTVRHMWAHATMQTYYRPELWSFMNACDNDPTSGERCLQHSATLDGAIEQITVVTSYQMTFANLPTAVPKHRGLTFRKQFETALDNPTVPIVTITGWNEWQGRRTPCGVADCDCATYPQGCFVDMYDVERSRDIEDGQNEMGDFYYRLLRACIALFRQGARCDAAHATDLCCGGS